MKIDFCQQFKTKQTDTGFLVETPLTYYDNDRVVVFCRRLDDGQYLVSDNGDAALRLMFDGIDISSRRLLSWLDEMPKITGVSWNAEKDELELKSAGNEIQSAIIAIAEASIQMQGMAVLRTTREESSFRDEVLSVLKTVAMESGIKATYDAPIDQGGQFIADTLFLAETPLAVVIAGSKFRLLEAELMWTNARRLQDPTRVIAVVESAKSVGIKEVARANYFTDKTLVFGEFETQFQTTIADTLVH